MDDSAFLDHRASKPACEGKRVDVSPTAMSPTAMVCGTAQTPGERRGVQKLRRRTAGLPLLGALCGEACAARGMRGLNPARLYRIAVDTIPRNRVK